MHGAGQRVFGSGGRRQNRQVPRDLFLALGLVLTPCTQLRLGNLPIGPGELCLVTWLAIVFVAPLQSTKEPATRALRTLFRFWMVFSLSLIVGFVTAAVIGDVQDAGLVMHDAVAYPLLMAVSLASVMDPSARGRLTTVAWLVVTLATLLLSAQLLQAFSILSMFPFDPWYWDRMRGWSQNPNQLAFFCCVLALLSLHLAEQASGTRGKAVAVLGLVLAVCVGILTKSDTFRYASIVGAAMFGVLKIGKWLRSDAREFPLRSAFAWSIVILVPVGLLLSIGLLSGSASEFALSLAKNGKQEALLEADLRLMLWQQAVERGLNTGLLGLGPGPHLAIPPELVAARQTEIEPGNLIHPQANGTANFEAHNTYLDLLTQGGAAAVVSFAVLIFVAFRNAQNAGLAGLAALVSGVSMCAVTGNVARNPIFWFAIALPLASGERHEHTTVARNPRTFRRVTFANAKPAFED